MTLLLMGGDMQAQGHGQTLVNIFDLGANVQAATDMARFHHSQLANELDLESNLYALVGQDLARMGHHVVPVGGGAVGGFQSILVTPATGGAPMATIGRAPTIARMARRWVGNRSPQMSSPAFALQRSGARTKTGGREVHSVQHSNACALRLVSSLA